MTTTTISITTPKYSAKDSAISFPCEKWAVPSNVLDASYFQTAVQFHAYVLGERFLSSEKIRIETKKYDSTDEKAVEKYENDLFNVKTAAKMFSAMYNDFKDNTTIRLKNSGMNNEEITDLFLEIENDRFARTYTAVMLKFYTHVEYGEQEDDGTMKSVKKQNTDIFQLKDSSGVCKMKSYVIALETILSDTNAKKDDKMKAYKPFYTHLQNALFPIDDGLRYKDAHFNKMSMRFFQAFLSSTRQDAEKGLAVKDPFILVKNLAYTGMAWLKVVDIEELEPDTEFSVSNIKKREPNKDKAPKAENTESGK